MRAGTLREAVRRALCARAVCAGALCASLRGRAVRPAEGMPPEAKPGEAWCRVTTPAQYQTVSETVCSQCAGCRRLWVPPVTETRYREVCVTPACSCEVDVPGVTRTVRTCETVCPSRTETRKVDCATGTGCGCPPQECYATVEIPAQTRTVAHEVCIQAPSKRVTYSPPRYRTEAVVCEIQPGHWETVQTPAIYETVTRQVCVAPEQTLLEAERGLRGAPARADALRARRALIRPRSPRRPPLPRDGGRLRGFPRSAGIHGLQPETEVRVRGHARARLCSALPFGLRCLRASASPPNLM